MIDRTNAYDAGWNAYCARAAVVLAIDHLAVESAFDAGLAALLADPATRDAIAHALYPFVTRETSHGAAADAVLRVLGTDQ